MEIGPRAMAALLERAADEKIPIELVRFIWDYPEIYGAGWPPQWPRYRRAYGVVMLDPRFVDCKPVPLGLTCETACNTLKAAVWMMYDSLEVSYKYLESVMKDVEQPDGSVTKEYAPNVH